MTTKHAQLKYLNRRLGEMASLEDLIEQKNFFELSRMVHTVTTSARALHLPELGNWAERLEDACHLSHEIERVTKARAALSRYRRTADQLYEGISEPADAVDEGTPSVGLRGPRRSLSSSSLGGGSQGGGPLEARP